jgi:hypothetical protein
VDSWLSIDVLDLLSVASPEEEPASLEAVTRRNEAAAGLRAAYRAWHDLPEAERTSRLEAALAPPEPEIEEPEIEEPEAEVPDAFVDEEVAQDREDISDKEEEAAEAARKKEEALDVARKARSEALRVVAEERARLLGIQEQQALFAADLPRWKERARELHESSLEWHRRVEEMVEFGGSEVSADELYRELQNALDDARTALGEAIGRAADPGQGVPSPPEDFNDGSLPADVDRADLVALRNELLAEVDSLTTEEKAVAWEIADLLRDDVVMLNRDRLRLLPSMSGPVRDELTGLGTAGRAQARRELAQIVLEFQFHALALPRELASLSSTIQARPLDLVIRALELVALIALFRWWRKHADGLLRRWRGPTWGLKQTPAQRIRVSAFWYLMRVRKPVEWLLLLALLPLIVGTASNALELRMLWLIFAWVQGARAIVLTVDAIAERQAIYGRSPGSNAELRYRSLRLIGLTITAVGLILTLTSDIVGQGTIYRWVFSGCWILVAPIGLRLVAQWRPIIVELLQSSVKTNALARWVVDKQEGWLGFLTAAIGGIWLVAKGTSSWLVRQLSGLDTTRKVLAYLFRREVAVRPSRPPRDHEARPCGAPSSSSWGRRATPASWRR